MKTKSRRRFRLIFIVMVCVFIVCSMGTLAACMPKKYGEFYSLQEAYDNGLLTKDDLKSIAYYHSGYLEEGFIPTPLYPEKLSESTENKIKQTWAYEKNCEASNSEIVKYTSLNSLSVRYNGTYNGAIAVVIVDNDNKHSLDVLYDEVIDGVKFVIHDYNDIKIWKSV